MSEKHEPHYLDEVEALIGPFLSSQYLDNVLRYESKDFFPQDLLAEAGTIYFGALRILAEQRAQDRPAVQLGGAAAWNEAWSAKNTFKRIAQIAEGAKEQRIELLSALSDLRLLCLHRDLEEEVTLAVSKSKEDTPAPRVSEATGVQGSNEQLRSHQHPYMNDIYTYLQQPPQRSTIKVDGVNKEYDVHGCTVVAPTGAGKSAVEGRTVAAASIGEPHPIETHRKKTCLFVTSSRELVEQHAGLSGDKTFIRFCPPGLKIDYYYSGVSEFPHDADVVIITDEMFSRHVRKGTIFGKKLDFLLIDEVHHLTSSQFKHSYLEHWRRPDDEGAMPLPTVGFTATADYSEEQDVRKILPYTIEHGDILSYMEEGILNHAQLFLLKVIADYDVSNAILPVAGGLLTPKDLKKQKQAAVRQAMVDFFTPRIEEGRRGIIFCEPGGGSKQARLLADDFSKVTLSNGENIVAKCLNFSQNSPALNKKHRDDYHAGKVQVLTSTAIGVEGLNAAFDFLGIGDIYAMLKLRQIMGRGTRLSEDFPTTIYAQFLSGNRRIRTFYHALGFDTVEQGVLIGPRSASGRVSRIAKDRVKALSKDDIPLPIAPMLDRVHNRQICEIYTNKQEVPADYVPFETIYTPAVKANISEKSAKNRLGTAGYEWIGQVERSKDQRVLRRYYEPAAASYFTDNPVPPFASNDHKSHEITAKLLGVSVDYLTSAYTKLRQDPEAQDLKTVNRLAKNGRVYPHYGPELRARLKQDIDAIPAAESTDKQPTTYAKKTGLSEATLAKYMAELQIDPVYKRLREVKGFGDVLSKEQQAAISLRAEKYPWATNAQWTRARIAREANVKNCNIDMTAEEEHRSEIYRCHPEGREGMVRELEHWQEEDARAIVTRLQNRFQALPAHLITAPMAMAFLDISDSLPLSFRRSERPQKIQLPGTRATLAFSWQSLRKLYQKYGIRAGTSLSPLDFDQLPEGPNDTRIERIIYARAFQLQLTTAARLGNPDGIID